jgi:plastocyanin
MAKILTLDILRIIPRDADFLDRRSGNRGDIFFDRSANTLRLYNGNDRGGFEIARADLANINNNDFLAKAIAAGVPSGGEGGSFSLKISADDAIERTVTSGSTLQFVSGQGIETTSSSNIITISNTLNTFNTISISEQPSLVASIQNSTLQFVAGSNVVLSSDPVNNSIMISALAIEGTASNSFEVIAVAGQSNIVAASPASILTLAAGTGISITTDPDTDTATITSTVSAGVTAFTGLSDRADLTIDQFYLPAITMLRVSNTGASAYLFDQYSGNNPTLYAISGTTIAFKLVAQGHPFLIQTPGGQNFNTGLIHVSTTGVVSTEGNAQGKDSGTLYWKVPYGISGGYRYQCSVHGPMIGSIVVKDFAVI